MNRKGRTRNGKNEARDHVYRTKGNGPCPYPQGSRQAAFWEKYRAHYWEMERLSDDMAAAYGEWRDDKKKGQ